MKIAIAGCVHGELATVYEDLQQREARENIKIDLVLICGDFQTVRNEHDLKCMAVPAKYAALGTFHEYYFGVKKAPYLTLFIGGNHEASNYLSVLPYGGWVAENIYYLGYAGVVRFGGLRIAGVSGIFKKFHVDNGHFECLPYSEDTKRSVYHTRALDAYRMMQISNEKDPQPLDIVLTHDWPLNIHTCGNVTYLLRKKPHFRQDIQNNALGNPLYEPLIPHLKPRYWFAAHLHVQFKAMIHHSEEIKTSFLALDKCLPRRPYLDVFDIEPKDVLDTGAEKVLEYDPEWLCILQKSNKYMSVEKFPSVRTPKMWIITDPVTDEDLKAATNAFEGDLKVPYNFALAEPVLADADLDPQRVKNYPNPQTVAFCAKLNLLDPISAIVKMASVPPTTNPDEINLDDAEFEDEAGDLDDDSVKKLKTDHEPSESVNGAVTDAAEGDIAPNADDVPLFFIDTKGKSQQPPQ